jgi:hypothetical protein
MKKFLLALSALCLAFISDAQTYNMSNTTVSIPCGTPVSFYDPGGLSGNYANGSNYTMTFCTSNGQNIYAQFSSITLENNWDYLYIYNGPSTASPLIGTYTGGNSPGTITGATTCLTFVFTSDGSINYAGWTATLGCGTPPPPPPPPPPASGLCDGAQPFCTGTTYTFPGAQNTTAQVGPNYGCLLSSPNPAWYYMQIQNGGPLTISMASTAGVDIDFALWGPFASITNVCGQLTGAPISCSFSTAATETATIGNAVAGQYYILVITNYSNLATNITFNQSGGTATTNCNILCNMTALTASPGPCDPATNTYDVTGTITFANPPASGTLIVSSSCGGSVNIPAPWVSPMTYTLSGLPSNGAPCTVTAAFSADILCALNQTITAPASCLPQCTVTASNSGNVCSGNPIVLNASAVVGATNYTWTGPNGYTASGQNVVLVGTTGLMSGTYTVTATGTATCSGTTALTITDNPVLTPISDVSACSGDNVNIPAFVSTPSGATMNWSNSNGAIGLGLSGSGNIPVFNASASGQTLNSSVTVLPVLNGCVGTPANFNVTVNPTPVASQVEDISLCEGSTVPSIAFTSNPAAQVNWNNTNASIGLPLNGSGDIMSFTGQVGSATITYTPTLNGCIGSNQSFQISVESAPQITLNAPSTICQNALPVAVTTNTSGGIWSGAANANGLIDPTLLPVGQADYTYTFSTANCDASVTQTIEIVAVPHITGNVPVCAGALLNLSATPSGGIWSGTGINSNGSFSQNVSGTYSISYADATNTCSVSEDIVVQDAPFVSLNCPAYVCNTDTPIAFNPSPSGGTWSGSGIDSFGNYTPALGSNPTVATYVYSDGVCTVTQSATIDVFATPIISLNNPSGICVNNSATVLSASPIGGTWTVNGNAAVVNGVLVPNGPETITLFYSIAGQCPSSANQTMQIFPLPSINAGPDVAHCQGQSISITATGGTAYVWSPSSGLNTTTGSTVNASVNGPSVYTVTGTDSNGCMNTDQVSVTVYTNPAISVSGDNLICAGESSILTAVGAVNYVWQPGGLANNSIEVSPNTTSTYSVVGTDSNGCQGTASYTVNVESIVANPSIFDSNDGDPFSWEFHTGSTGIGETYTWIPGDGGSEITTSNEQTDYTYLNDLMGSVILTINTAACEEEFTLPLLISTVELIFPNIITADGDGVNDDFRLLPANTLVVSAFNDFSCKIFTRWGHQQGEFNDVMGSWNPTDLNTGTYFYTVEYVNAVTGEYVTHEGTFYLKR